MNLKRTIAAVIAPVICVGAGCLTLKSNSNGGGGGGGGPPVCSHATVPLPPNVQDDTSNDVTFVTAIRSIHFKPTPGSDPIGLDLDRYCTCQGETPSCIAPKDQTEDLECDLAEGRDNIAPLWIRIFEAVLLFDPEGDQMSELYSEYAYLGRWSTLVRVSGYNGMPDDPKVRVDWLPSPGTTMPKWDGSDTWPTTVNKVEPNGDPRYFDEAAYVTNNKLVFALPEAFMQMTNGTSNFSLQLSDGTGTANIEKNANSQYDLRNGVLAGRIPIADLFRMVTDFRDHNGEPFCASQSNPYYGVTRDIFCRNLDIQSGFPQPNKPCDAASFAIGFDADPIAGVGAPAAPPSNQLNCAPGEDPFSVFLAAGCPPPDMPNLDAGNAPD